MKMGRTAVGGALAGVMMLGVVTGPASAVVPERDPERYSSVSAGPAFQVMDKNAIDTWLNQNNSRVIDVEPAGNAFSVVTVTNSGPTYTRSPGGSFSWTTGETHESLKSKIGTQPYKRLIDVERHTVAGQTRFAAAWVDNTGAAAKSWWWYLNITKAEVDEKRQDCTCRLIDVDPLGGGRYDVIMIPSSGDDYLVWDWMPAVTIQYARNQLAANHMRPVDLEPNGSGLFSVLAVQDGLVGGMSTDQTWSDLVTWPPGMRYLHVKNYTNVDGESVWLSVYLQTN
ncbi:hypothetical protein LZG04_27155 [Saccharothrix sp. S26]|uniref:hypothetical protein n=1 Tax=Saccharothrix sp. S26 TaxID=2907215 RepID=UPI001F47D8C3|nr:hypothetical protein [Saccharothrix sp. S26]MCE6998451.1 hypothetical protein [Saccharothrix sp. S26]